MQNRFRSAKTIIEIDQILTDKKYNFPKSFANDRNPDDQKASILVIINGFKHFIPVEEDVDLPHNVYCVLKDSPAYKNLEQYCLSRAYDPFLEKHENG